MPDFSRIQLARITSRNTVIPVALEFMGFPGGERHVWIKAEDLEPDQVYVITAHIYSSAGVMDLLLLNDALRRVVGERAEVRLEMPYLPYARQDRVSIPGEPLSIKVFCSLINGMHFAGVTIADPHSLVGSALLERVEIMPLEDRIADAIRFGGDAEGKAALVAPDAGAHKRVLRLGEVFNLPVVLCAKARNPATGRLSGTRILDEVPDLPLLVVDDICDGGGTFAALAPVLRAGTKHPVSLMVTHGLLTKGVEPLRGYQNVFTAFPRDPSLWQPKSSRLYGIHPAASAGA